MSPSPASSPKKRTVKKKSEAQSSDIQDIELLELPNLELLRVHGARVHNLRNISVDIPRNQFVVITGISGSGKSSLAFDTIYAEGQRRYMESLSAYARQFIGSMERPDVDNITGLSPVISIEQKTTSRNPRSTVGTVTEVYDFLRLLYILSHRQADRFKKIFRRPETLDKGKFNCSTVS